MPEIFICLSHNSQRKPKQKLEFLVKDCQYSQKILNEVTLQMWDVLISILQQFQMPTDPFQVAKYVQDKDYKAFKVNVRDAIVLLDKCNNGLVKDLSSIESIDISWMDTLFRPDNDKRKQQCRNYNIQLTEIVITLRANLILSFQTITQPQYKDIQDAMKKLNDRVTDIKEMSKLVKGVLGTAFFAILFGYAIAFGIMAGGIGVIFTMAAALVAAGIAYFIVEGMAVDQRYKKLEEIKAGYKKSITDFQNLSKEFPL